MSFAEHIRRMDWTLIIVSIILVIFGLVAIYSASIRGNDFSNLWKQIGFFGFSLILMFAVSFIDSRAIRENPIMLLSLYFLCIMLLIGVFFFAPEIRGIKSWYKIGIFSFDPIEPTKIILILILAKYFSKRHIELYRIRHIILSGIYALVPSVLIFLQPELGSVMIIGTIWIAMLLVSGIKIRHFIVLCLFFVLISLSMWSFVLKDYQRNRVMSFVVPHEDPLGEGWSQNQSKISIGSGGLFGKGIGNGSQTQYGFLPEPQTDFVFSVIGEETGFLGTATILSLFGILFWRILRIALNAQSNFPRLFAIGLAISMFIQIVINIGMNLGILPVIGIPLPLVSYGGSNLIFTFIALGILQNMKVTEA
ncbi:MAG: rod shape-determining protein RodA [Candidatus Pacebacteria bacterium]|nr:rod shape-determining protein RodA [Candidatus Paceibacterota bacterium]